MVQRLGNFPDAWDPEECLVSAGFGALAACESILAVGDAPDGDDGDLLIRAAWTDTGVHHEETIHSPQGHARLAYLREVVQEHLSLCGNSHWGDQTDVSNLSVALGLGIFIFLQSTKCWQSILSV